MKSVNKKKYFYKELQNDPNNFQLQSEYKNYEEIVDKLIQTNKKEYYQNKISENKSNSRILWKYI